VPGKPKMLETSSARSLRSAKPNDQVFPAPGSVSVGASIDAARFLAWPKTGHPIDGRGCIQGRNVS
jgi:hypothetical protein